MPIFSDIFIAQNASDAISYKVTAPNLPHVILEILTDYEISALWASLTRSKVTDKHELTFIEIDSDSLLYQFPTAFTDSLAQLDDKKITTTASLWAEQDDMPWRKDKTLEKLKEIHSLAQQAKKEDKALFLIFV